MQTHRGGIKKPLANAHKTHTHFKRSQWPNKLGDMIITHTLSNGANVLTDTAI